MSLPFSYSNHGRRPATAMAVTLIWGGLVCAYFWLDASALVLLVLGAFTLPALYDLLVNPHSTLTLDARTLRWCSGRQHAEIALHEIDHLRFDTRLEMSVRLSVVRSSDISIRVPYAATPPHVTFEVLAQQAGIATRRHHFALIS